MQKRNIILFILMTKINLFLTFDYELPLGGWAVSPEDALIKPTNKLLELCEQLQISVVFFVDVLSFIQFRRLKDNAFEKLVRKQLIDIVKRGHDIQLHLHPHWLTSCLTNEIYKPSNDFKLSDFSEQEIANMVAQGIDYLNEIAKQANPNYRCLAFRAGGYNLENSPLIFRILAQNGILIDSSVCSGYYFASDISTVDYRCLPKQVNWFFKDGKYNEPASSGIYEIQIAGKKKSIFEMPTFIKTKIYKNRTPENRGKMIHVKNKLSFRKKIKMAFSSRMLSFDNYTYSTRFLIKILNYNVTQFRKQDEINLAIISHPKSMDWYNFKLMEDFVASVRKLYGNRVAFTTFQHYGQRFF